MNQLFMPADTKYIKLERNKARELKKTQWWKNKLSLGKCYYCVKQFEKQDLSMDHLVPLVRGGRSTRNNVVVSCQKCNSHKKYQTPVEMRLDK